MEWEKVPKERKGPFFSSLLGVKDKRILPSLGRRLNGFLGLSLNNYSIPSDPTG